MNQEDLKKRIIDKIDKEKIAPKPRWHFLLRNIIMWFAGVISLLIGGAATSLIIFRLVNNNWEVYRFVSGGFWPHLGRTLPFLWIASLILFMLAAEYNFRHTKSGYRYPLASIILTSVIISVGLGFGLYLTHTSHLIDNELARRLPAYEQLTERQAAVWSQPERGLLAGLILAREENGDFTLQDFDEQEWLILTDHLEPLHQQVVAGAELVRVLGMPLDDQTFLACAVAPWELRGENPRVYERGFQPLPGSLGARPPLRSTQDFGERKFFDVRITECEGPSAPEKIININN